MQRSERPRLRHILFVPGNGQWRDHGIHLPLARELEILGYELVFVDIDWDEKTLTGWIQQLLKVARTFDSGTYGIIGFSFGAMTAALGASILCQESRDPAVVVLVGLSGFFADDLPARKRESILGNLRQAVVDDFRDYPFERVQIPDHVPVALVRGENEFRGVKSSMRRARRVIRHAWEENLRGVGHTIDAALVAHAVGWHVDALAKIPWHTFMDEETGAGMQVRRVGDSVEMRHSDHPDTVLYYSEKAWQELVMGINANGPDEDISSVPVDPDSSDQAAG